MIAYIESHTPLLLCLLACTAVTVLPRIIPFYVLRSTLPGWLRDWLNFVPAAVMAALVFPDVFFYQGNFSPNPLENLFLMAAICTLLFSVLTKNFFGTIVFAMAFVAGMRYLGWMV